MSEPIREFVLKDKLNPTIKTFLARFVKVGRRSYARRRLTNQSRISLKHVRAVLFHL
jgi:hypothetical protein